MTGWWSCSNVLLQEGVCRYSVWSLCLYHRSFTKRDFLFQPLAFKITRYQIHFLQERPNVWWPLRGKTITHRLHCIFHLLQPAPPTDVEHFWFKIFALHLLPGFTLYCLLICKMLTRMSPLRSLFQTLICVFFVFDSEKTAKEPLYLHIFKSQTITSDHQILADKKWSRGVRWCVAGSRWSQMEWCTSRVSRFSVLL